MKKMVSTLVALVLVFSMLTASAAVSSKTTTDNTQVQKVESVSGVEVAETFTVAVTEDKAPVVEEITKLFTYVTEEKKAPVTYFPVETQEKIKEVLTAKVQAITGAAATEAVEIPNIEEMELNEFITIEPIDYEEEYGDIKTSFSFVTQYEVEQHVIVLISLYTGEVDENGENIVEWIVLDAEVQEDGSLAVVIPQAEMLKMQTAEAVALAVLSEPVEVVEETTAA